MEVHRVAPLRVSRHPYDARVVAESVLVKQQLLILNRSQKRSPISAPTAWSPVLCAPHAPSPADPFRDRPRNQARTRSADARMSVRIDGSHSVVGCIRRRRPRDMYAPTECARHRPKLAPCRLIECHRLQCQREPGGRTDSDRIIATAVFQGCVCSITWKFATDR